MQEAQEAIQSLANIVSDVLSNNQDIGRRLGNMDLPTTLRHRSAPSALEGMESMYEDLSLDGPNRNSYASSAATIVEERTERNSTFEQDLRTSRVYSKVSSPERRRSIHDPLPLQSSATDSVQSSTLSSLSLADVSDISMLSLPIAASALSNGQRYMRQSATNLVKTYQFRKFSPRSRPMTRVLLLG